MSKYSALIAAVLIPIAAAASESPARDYQRLSGTWQLTSAFMNGKPVPASQVRRTILITDYNRFWLPHASQAATHAAGTFRINPTTVPKQVDSKAVSGGALTRGIYEIIDSTHQRECWANPGEARPTSFSRSACHILQYWKKIGPVPKRTI